MNLCASYFAHVVEFLFLLFEVIYVEGKRVRAQCARMNQRAYAGTESCLGTQSASENAFDRSLRARVFVSGQMGQFA